MAKNKGKYIVFEGIVGSGKTTQSKILAEKLGAVWTKEPGGDEISNAIRKIVQGTEFGEEMDPVCEQYLYAASRAQTLRRVVLPVLKNGGTVVSDRSVFTSLAYQGYGRKLGEKVVWEINQKAVEKTLPDLIFLIDLDINIALSRTKDQSGDKFETYPKEFFDRVVKGYLETARKWKNKMVVIDGSGTIEEVAGRVWKVGEDYGI